MEKHSGETLLINFPRLRGGGDMNRAFVELGGANYTEALLSTLPSDMEAQRSRVALITGFRLYIAALS